MNSFVEPCPALVDWVSPFYRDSGVCPADKRHLTLTPWTVQNICYELIANYMLANDPREQGYVFSQKYDRDPRKTEIFLDLAYNYRDDVVQKRPAIFVSRGGAQYRYPTMNQQIGANSAESEKTKLSIVQMPVTATVVGTNVGFTEQLAEYVSFGILHFLEQIRNDFNFRVFRLEEMAGPVLYLESKDHFAVSLNFTTAFDIGFVIKGDHLKLKTVSYTIFNNCASIPFQYGESQKN